MSRLEAAGGSRLSSPDLLKLKYYLINTVTRELESEGVPVDKREEASNLPEMLPGLNIAAALNELNLEKSVL